METVLNGFIFLPPVWSPG